MTTHRAVADATVISSSNSSFYIRVLQETVRQHDMEGEETTPKGNGKKKELAYKLTIAAVIGIIYNIIYIIK